MSRRSAKNRLPDHGSRKEAPPPTPGFRTRDARAAAVVCCLLLLAVAVVFGRTIGHDFVNYDDDRYVYQNPVVQKGVSLPGVRWALTYGEIGHWHPLTWLSHMLDVQIYGLRAGGHHLTSVLLHAAASVLLFLVLWRMTGFLWRSAFVAALFAVHPLRAESVAWVAERKDVLGALFFMLTLGAYVGAVRRPASRLRYWTVVLLFALGLLSKNMLVTLPFVLLLLDYWPLNRVPDFAPRRLFRLAAEKAPLFALAAASCVITFLVPEEVSPGDRLPVLLRLENAVVSSVIYLRQLVFPAGLACHYPNPEGSLPFWQVGGALAVLLAVSGTAVAFRRSHPYLVVGWLWYLGMMVPVIGIVQISSYAHADRYTYLPQIGISLLLTWAAADLVSCLRRRSLLLGGSAAIIVPVLMYCAYTQVSHWRNSEALWTRALASTTRNAAAHYNLGIVLAERGEIAAAVAQYREALEIRPGDADVLNNLGNALTASGRIDAAIIHYRKALEIRPGDEKAHNNLGIALARSGRIDSAVFHFRKALEIKPDYGSAHSNLGNALAMTGQTDAAIAHFEQLLRIEPDNAEAHNNLGVALARSGRIDSAVSHFQKALEIKPDYLQARDNRERALQRRN